MRTRSFDINPTTPSVLSQDTRLVQFRLVGTTPARLLAMTLACAFFLHEPVAGTAFESFGVRVKDSQTLILMRQLRTSMALESGAWPRGRNSRRRDHRSTVTPPAAFSQVDVNIAVSSFHGLLCISPNQMRAFTGSWRSSLSTG